VDYINGRFGVIIKSAAICAITVALASELPAQDTRSTVDRLTREWVAAYNAGQPDRLAALVRDDVLLILPGREPILGRAAFRDTYAEDIKTTTKRSISVTSMRVEQSGDLLVDIGQWSFDGTATDGTVLHGEGTYVTLWKQTDGEWKTAIDISTRRVPDAR
jgi:uncharacterized protein (TIGR02246 family)